MPIVLVADDDPANRQVLTMLLGYQGHHLLEAADGAEALEQVRSEHPDLVIADVLMPVMDGYEFVRQLRHDPKISKTPVVFYTASYHEREARALAQACGVNHVITKPAEPEDILAVVTQVLGSSQQVNVMASAAQEFDRDHVRLLTDKLSENVKALEASNQRLADLIAATQLLASEHSAEDLLTRFCSICRALIGARFAFVGILAEDAQVLKPVFSSGADSMPVKDGGEVPLRNGILARLFEEAGPVRVADVSNDLLVSGLPDPPLGKRSFLGTTLSTLAGTYGGVWVLEKIGGGDFSDEDERVLVSLAAQASVAYENLQRFRQIQEHAAELERRVRDRTAELSYANKELEAFAYSVSHDLRAPLRHINSYCQILSEEHGNSLPSEAREYLGQIRTSSLEMAQLVEDLLKLSQVGRHNLRLQVTSLNLLLREVLHSMETETTGREIEWKIGPLPQMECDPVLIRQVFTNLVSNAVKYTRPCVHAMIEIGTIHDDATPVIFVRDNGVGFDMKYADRLFGVFQRLHSPEEFEGTGAGLAIAQRILRRHHGKIWAKAAPNTGAAFYFTIGATPTAESLRQIPEAGS